MWAIETTDTFDAWFDGLNDADRANVLASLIARERPRTASALCRHSQWVMP